MKLLLILLLFTLNTTLFSQHMNIWTAFTDSTTELVGYKDSKGSIMIPAKFMGFTRAYRFDKIIAVMENVNNEYLQYYVTKSGRVIGKDSLYIFDNFPDCESEGFIIFTDKNSGKVGMFNSDGNVAIAAEYNSLSSVKNGMIMALKNSKKKHIGKHQPSGCDHYYTWEGGQELVLDTNNNVLIENFTYNGNLNFFSVEISDTASLDPSRESFLGTNKKYYSFVNNEKEFTVWLDTLLSNPITKEGLVTNSYEEIKYWDNDNGWVKENNEAYIAKNSILLIEVLSAINKKDIEHNIFKGTFYPFTYEEEKFKAYFTNCNEAKTDIYPLMELLISHKIDGKIIQDHFDFLKVDNRYQLISVTIRSKKGE